MAWVMGATGRSLASWRASKKGSPPWSGSGSLGPQSRGWGVESAGAAAAPGTRRSAAVSQILAFVAPGLSWPLRVDARPIPDLSPASIPVHRYRPRIGAVAEMGTARPLRLVLGFRAWPHRVGQPFRSAVAAGQDSEEGLDVCVRADVAVAVEVGGAAGGAAGAGEAGEEGID